MTKTIYGFTYNVIFQISCKVDDKQNHVCANNDVAHFFIYLYIKVFNNNNNNNMYECM